MIVLPAQDLERFADGVLKRRSLSGSFAAKAEGRKNEGAAITVSERPANQYGAYAPTRKLTL